MLSMTGPSSTSSTSDSSSASTSGTSTLRSTTTQYWFHGNDLQLDNASGSQPNEIFGYNWRHCWGSCRRSCCHCAVCHQLGAPANDQLTPTVPLCSRGEPNRNNPPRSQQCNSHYSRPSRPIRPIRPIRNQHLPRPASP